MNWQFWIKTVLCFLTPGGYGHYRALRRYRDPNYMHEQSKHPLRHKHSGKSGWQPSQQGQLVYRDYRDYAEYVTHQQQKYAEILKIYGGFTNREIVRYRLKFYRRFRWLPSLLPKDASIICAGARQGTEVEVLRDLGFVNAWGIDLNPGPANPLVRYGDFMHMDSPDSSVDMLYTNCVDHAFNLSDFFAEHARVIRADGYVLYDLSLHNTLGETGPFEAVAWKNDADVLAMMLRYFRTVVRVETELEWRWILLRDKWQTAQS